MVICAAAFDVGRTRFERNRCSWLSLQLGGVFDRDDALAVRNEIRQHVEQRRLAGAGAAGDDDVLALLRRRLSGTSPSMPTASRSRSDARASSRFLANLRIVRVGPLSASGGMIALTREPSLSRASTIGEDSSMRRPSGATMRSMTPITARSLENDVPCCTRRPTRST